MKKVLRILRKALRKGLFLFAVFAPFVALIAGIYLGWGRGVDLFSLFLLVAFAIPTGFGITIGYHRLFTHQSFKTTPSWEFGIGTLGCATGEGPPSWWVATHRIHHKNSDEEGDPHTPWGRDGLFGGIIGFIHAHIWWMIKEREEPDYKKLVPDLLEDPVVRFLDKTFFIWFFLGLIIPTLLGWAWSGFTPMGALRGFLWGGLIRILLVHHITWSVNSVCHVKGKRPFKTQDHSGNVGWLKYLTGGESFHNNHHAYPKSACHGLLKGQDSSDYSYQVIKFMERRGWVWDVIRPTEEQIQARLKSQGPLTE